MITESETSEDILGPTAKSKCQRLRDAHKNVSETFLEILNDAVVHTHGNAWKRVTPKNMAVTFAKVKLAMWEELDGRFHKQTFFSYFSVAKKCLRFSLVNWHNVKDTSEDTLENAAQILKKTLTGSDKEKINDEKSNFYVEKRHTLSYSLDGKTLPWEEAMWYIVSTLDKPENFKPRDRNNHSMPQIQDYNGDSAKWAKEVVSFLGSMAKVPTIESVLNNSKGNKLIEFLQTTLNDAYILTS
jgi:hypothetical protein